MKWYNVVYYTLSDAKKSVDILADDAEEAVEKAKILDETFCQLMSVSHLPHKLPEHPVWS